MVLKNFENLIDFAIPTEEWSFLNQFCKDAADCPDIDTQTVLSLAKQHLGSAVPKSLDFMRKGLNWNSKSAGESKVRNFKHS